MISYDHHDNLRIIIRLTGSVAPKCIPVGIFEILVGGMLGLFRKFELTEDIFTTQDYISHRFNLAIIGSVMGYLLVMRTNMALDRWMSGITEVQSMHQKWGFAHNCLNGFFSGKTASREVLDRIHYFRVRIAHWFALLSCIAVANLRTGHEAALREVGMYPKFPSESGPSTFSPAGPDLNGQKDHGSGAQDMKLTVLHAPTPEEFSLLATSHDKVHTICLWITQAIMVEVRHGTLDAPPPITTRIFQEISQGVLGFHQALKVAHVPFPFPFAQMVAFLLSVFYVVVPFYIDVFTKSLVLTPVISSIICMSFCGLNLISVELEAPFGTDLNDIDMEHLHEAFVATLEDVVRTPMSPPVDAGNKIEREILLQHESSQRWSENRISGNEIEATTSPGNSSAISMLQGLNSQVADASK